MSAATTHNLIAPERFQAYGSMSLADRDDLARRAIDAGLTPFGLDPIGLRDAPVNATLVTGDYVALHTHGWTEFRIDATTGELTVITWGVEPGTSGPPAIISEFRVTPH